MTPGLPSQWYRRSVYSADAMATEYFDSSTYSRLTDTDAPTHTHLSTFKSYGPSTDLCLPVQHALSPVAGTMINVVNDRLQVENPPNGWPITAESGWQEYHNKVDQTFEEIVADLANTRFNKTVFEGTATAQAFEWDIAMETC